MQNKKVTMLAAVLAVTVIAMAGVGYAVAGFYAQTTNTDNEISTTHIVMLQTGEAAYDKNFLTSLGFDTETVGVTDDQDHLSVTTTYKPKLTGVYNAADATYTAGTVGANAALISKELTLEVNPTGIEANQKANLVVTVDATPNTASGMSFIMLLDAYGDTKMKAEYNTNNGNWAFENINVKAGNLVVSLIVTLPSSLEGDPPTTGFKAIDSTPDNGNTFTFKLTTI